jgi:glycerol-3-phosphate acyltransferase PlsY
MKIACLLLAYLLGSISFGYLFFRLGAGKDIRGLGSRSTGATNVLRLKGWKYALPVLVFDVLKAVLPVWLVMTIFNDRRLALGIAFAVVLGHCFPIFLNLRGGKGVSTAMGAYLVLAPPQFLLSLAVFVVVIALTRFVSLGSLLATLSFPFLALFMRGDGQLAWLGLAVFTVILIRHWGNLQRLRRGQERKIGQKE